MRKIATVFVRDPDDLAHVTRDVHPDCQWVIDGEGVPTRKFDGTCVMLDSEGAWWARREVKPGKATPPNYQLEDTDPVTGKVVGWEPIAQSSFAKWLSDALTHTAPLKGEPGSACPPGTYELVGPKINGNPENAPHHLLIKHTDAEPFLRVRRTYDGLNRYCRKLLEQDNIEGIVFHHHDGRMAKIKGKDFPA